MTKDIPFEDIEYKEIKKIKSKAPKPLFPNDFVFYATIIVLTIAAGLVFRQPTIAMWLGFAVAGFAAISNDSIQTLGTFLTSNKRVAWYWLWLFIGGIFVVTILYSWFAHDGDISYERLEQIPQPQSFTFFQLLAPIILLILTRYQIPVSTTFLILATFSSSDTLGGMIGKTMLGYVLAFAVSFGVWGAIGFSVSKKYKKFERKMTPVQKKKWRVAQWAATGFMWFAWLAQDNANAVVFLPRSLSVTELVIAISLMVLGIGLILYRRGGEIQNVVYEKTDVVYIKSATLIDVVYALILVYFKNLNSLPMSTTWVFLGLLAGREIAMKTFLRKTKSYKKTLKMVKKDIIKAGFGLGISLAMAFLVNDQL